MTAQRLKGQEVSIIITRGGNVEDTLTDIMNFNWVPKLEIKEQGYLGETTNRHDFIYNGVKFDFEMHVHSQDYFKFRNALIDKARRKTPDLEINITGTFFFPSGESPIVTLPDCSFGEQPLNASSRGDYVKIKVDGACDSDDIQLS